MIPPRILGIAGSTSCPSKTRALVAHIVDDVARRTGASGQVNDLTEVLPELGTTTLRSTAPEKLEAMLSAIETADALVFGSPIYKGSYSGLFKHLMDLVDPLALVGKPVLICATGGGQRHALAVEHQMRPLFGFFSAATVPSAIYASEADFENGVLTAAPVRKRCEIAACQLAGMLGAIAPTPISAAL
ncbi:FMN reductase [Xaviernesmea oryzae]|uniref:FMN reductase n=1 Tax=Xaviernesmea oryzae TaxID=464029 RepID=A0A1X7FZ23_9HYPH|nr:FMN reductase [Xaviernesmea oryzae]SMF60826.1 FMN reductase [Xaviernesmea oryzae]